MMNDSNHTTPIAGSAARFDRRWSMLGLWLCATALLLAGFWLRWPTVRYRDDPNQGVYNNYAFDTFSYSDIASLYFRDQLQTHPRPYFDYPLEYPVGMGILIYALNSVRSYPAYFLWSSACLSLLGLATVAVVGWFPSGKRWLIAAAPGLTLYVNLNWDFWGVLLTVLALWCWLTERRGWAGALLAAAVWTKFFPIVLLPLLGWPLLLAGDWRRLIRPAISFSVASALINGPLLILKPAAWWHFFSFNQTRGREVNFWNFFDRYQPSTATINRWSAILLIGGMLLLLALQWRNRRAAILPLCCAAIAWFFFINKIYSPQYSLWITVLLAVAGAPTALAIIWGAVDLLYFLASFNTLGLSRFEDAGDWFYRHTLIPAMTLREACLLAVIAWCVWAAMRNGELRIEN